MIKFIMQRINCRKCIYFFVTWNQAYPYGCKAYGFKGKVMPSIMVQKSSGSACKLFSVKSTK